MLSGFELYSRWVPLKLETSGNYSVAGNLYGNKKRSDRI